MGLTATDNGCFQSSEAPEGLEEAHSVFYENGCKEGHERGDFTLIMVMNTYCHEDSDNLVSFQKTILKYKDGTFWSKKWMLHDGCYEQETNWFQVIPETVVLVKYNAVNNIEFRWNKS